LDGLAPIHAFQACAFNHSATSPARRFMATDSRACNRERSKDVGARAPQSLYLPGRRIIMAKLNVLPTPEQALPGRANPIPTAKTHHVTGRPLHPPYPEGLEESVFGLGCFWGAERKFWQSDGVWVTASGYAGGVTPNPTYEEVCSGRTGHA